MKKQLIAAALGLGLMAGGCAQKAIPLPPVPPPSSVVSVVLEPPAPPPTPPSPEPMATPQPGALPLVNDYIAQAADRVLAEIITPTLTPVEQVRTVYRWLVENTAFFNQPVGLDVWRWRGDSTQVPGYVENRALSPLLFGIGSCEDYAGAAVVLLQRLGLPARYVAGLTISVQGTFVDHAWAVVELDGVWYHLDPQLEDNVTRHNLLTYRYFLKSDSTMLADHRWDENLIAYYGGSMSPERQQAVRENWSVPECPRNLTPPPSETLTPPPTPDREAVAHRLAQEKADYLANHGPLPSIPDHTQPPVL